MYPYNSNDKDNLGDYLKEVYLNLLGTSSSTPMLNQQSCVGAGTDWVRCDAKCNRSVHSVIMPGHMGSRRAGPMGEGTIPTQGVIESARKGWQGAGCLFAYT